MSPVIIILTASVALACAPALAQSPRVQGKAGHWVKVETAGLAAYENVNNRSGDTISINCDEAQTDDHSNTGISVEIGGKMLPAGSQIIFAVDGESITIAFDRSPGGALEELRDRMNAGIADVAESPGQDRPLAATLRANLPRQSPMPRQEPRMAIRAPNS
ncbi:hypothetical protein [Ensifer sp. LCM 4579]|uniref:hypothetical protein n=1 Tax=Ensifer sp. LCM 4579 TaxID=1848292 RepID=UPI0008D9A555|nr:hypothetical protein [Ensifer sp. LCM 4579]OHV81789.1 hypothetical protein LCM4579_18505 [Ensifer sp. LCM 4579]